MITPERNRVVDAASGLTRPRLRPYWTTPYGGSELSVDWGRRLDAICLPSDVPVRRAWRLKRTILTRPAFGKSFDCLPSLWRRRRLRPALSPPSLLGTLDLLAAADRRRWNTIERHHSRRTGAWRPLKSILRSRPTKMQPRRRRPRGDLPASTRREHGQRTAKSSIRTN